MSTSSPSSVLYSSDGTELTVQSGSSIPTNTRTLLISGSNPSGQATYIPSSSSGALGIAQMSDGYVVRSNATLTASGSALLTNNWFGTQQINLVVNITATPTGTTPTITFTIQEVDPGNGTTVYGQSASTTALNSIGVTAISISGTTSPMVQVSWTVTGTTPSFTGLYATVTTRATPATQPISGTVTANNSSVGTDGSTALTFDTQVGGKVTTAAPTYVTGNLNALSLTTLGGLRVDGVYATGTANATAADAMVNGAYVTTAAPTYTTGQLNSLSLNTSGGLRIDGVSATGATTGSTAVLSGGAVTTAAPAYTTGQMDPLSLTTVGGLRVDGVYPQATANGSAPDVMVSGGYVTTAAPTYTTGQLNPLSLDTSGNLRVNVTNTTLAVTQSTSPWIVAGGGTAGTAATGVVTVQGISGMTPISVTANKSSTSNFTTVAGAASSTSILASNANRIAASLYNNTNKNMYILCNSGTASATNFTIMIMQQSYWEVPSDYTGAINAIWQAGVTGSVNVTEFTP